MWSSIEAISYILNKYFYDFNHNILSNVIDIIENTFQNIQLRLRIKRYTKPYKPYLFNIVVYKSKSHCGYTGLCIYFSGTQVQKHTQPSPNIIAELYPIHQVLIYSRSYLSISLQRRFLLLNISYSCMFGINHNP